MKQKELWHKWPHLEFHSIFNQVGINPHFKKNLQFEGQREQIKKRILFCPSPTEVFQPVVAWLNCSECTILKAGLFIQRNCWHSLLVKNYGRKAHSSKSQTWSKKACSDCSNWPVSPEFHWQNPCPVGFLFPFPSLRKGQCVVQAGEPIGLSLPLIAWYPLLLLHWIGTWWAEVQCVCWSVSHSQETTALCCGFCRGEGSRTSFVNRYWS